MLKRFLRGAGSFLGRVASLLLLCAVRGQNSEAAPEHTNRLIAERSPYLLQHAHNPVDWYPWGEEAFAKARKENKPIFLSVGYSTCHWCHVMERESFENPAIAGLLNDHFISIKVDREERPDVDATYMAFIQATTGGGGWPMTVFLTPDLKPFTGGTYFPAVDSDGQPGLETILPGIADAWQHHAPEIAQRADELLAKLREFTSTSADEPGKDALGLPLLNAAYKQLSSHFDAGNGGFGAAPKFPQPANLDLLTRVYARQGANTAEGQRALEMDLFTLRRMAAGGIHDHLGGGFHRYATDARWHVPHFEKMLYDQAQLTIAYLEAYQITGDEQYADTARDILGYVRRDLTDPLTGGFLSAEDADSQPEAASGERVEGAFYVWTPTQIDQVLGTDRAPLFDWYYGVVETGSVAVGSDPRGELNGRNVLDSGDRTMDDAAAKFQTTAERVSASLAGARALLLAARANRPRPTRDDKIITAWNGLAISAFARAYVVLGDRAYLDAARKAAGFLQTIVYDRQTGQLKRSYREGASEIAGFSDDYAFLVRGLIDLYEADFQPEHLRWAEALQATQDKLFWDEKSGGYFNTAGANPDQLLRSKTDDDGAEPSANSVAALNLLRLGQALESEADIKRAAAVLQAFGGTLQRAPLSLPEMLVALDLQIGPARQIVVAGPRDAADTVAMLDVARKLFLPRTILLLADGGSSQEFLATHVDLLKDAKPQGGRATAYVCQNFACQLPTSDLATVRKLLLSLPVLAPRATH